MITNNAKNIDHTIVNGTQVRSFDFLGVDSCYMDGVCEGIVKRGEPLTLSNGEVVRFGDCDHYAIRVIAQVVEGVEYNTYPDYVFPPVNGTPNGLPEGTFGVADRNHEEG